MVLLPFHRLDEPRPPARTRPGQAETRSRGAQKASAGGAAAKLPFDPLLVGFCIALLFIYVGAEVGVSGWIAEYFVSVLGSTPAQGAILVTLFWAGILAGRLLLAFFYTGTNSALTILVLASIAAAGLIVAVAAGGPVAATAGFIAAGFGCSCIYPLVMSIVGRYVPARRQSVAVGLASSGGGIGALVFPLPIAAVAQQIGIRRGFLLYVLLTLLLMALAFATVLKTRAIDRSRT
jgi:fucose permease